MEENTLSKSQISKLNNWISEQYVSTDELYRCLVEVFIAYSNMYVTLNEISTSDDAGIIGKREDLYVLRQLIDIFKSEQLSYDRAKG